jgi:hypothetical protein
MVSGCVLRKRRAAMVEGIREPPKEFRAFGRLNYEMVRMGVEMGMGIGNVLLWFRLDS